jgi:predicted hydrocarbon binding protein
MKIKYTVFPKEIGKPKTRVDLIDSISFFTNFNHDLYRKIINLKINSNVKR